MLSVSRLARLYLSVSVVTACSEGDGGDTKCYKIYVLAHMHRYREYNIRDIFTEI